ncbi:MAG: hypothetical protein HKN79_04420 [Flavobacteriales bacterium]|nr:hypothetical protein [Flavobacteriales bacterium]
MDLKKINDFLEKFWLTVAIGTTLYGIYFINQFGLEGNWMYALLPLVAFVFYGMRRSMRKRMEKDRPDD